MSKANGKHRSPLELAYLERKRLDEARPPADVDFPAKAPTVWAYLTDNRLGQEHTCELGRLTIRVVGGDWLFSLWLPGVGGRAEAMARTFAEGIAALEKHLAEHPHPFRFFENAKTEIRKNAKSKMPDLEI